MGTMVNFLSLPMGKTTTAHASLMRPIQLLNNSFYDLFSAQTFDMAVQNVLSRLDGVNPQQLAKVWMNRKFNHVLVQEIKDLTISPLETDVKRVFVILFQFIQVVKRSEQFITFLVATLSQENLQLR